MIACPSPRNSQVTGRKLRALLFWDHSRIILLTGFTVSSPGVCQHPSSIWSVTLPVLKAYQAAIPHLKEDSNTFHMTSHSLIPGSLSGCTSTSHMVTSLVSFIRLMNILSMLTSSTNPLMTYAHFWVTTHTIAKGSIQPQSWSAVVGCNN